MGKASKKGWRNIKLTEELTNLADKEEASELQAKVDTLFTEDIIGGMQGVSKSIRKDIELHSKSNKAAASISEIPLIEKALKRIGTGSQRSTPQPKRTKLVDLWGDEPVAKRRAASLPGSVLRRESFAPAVLPATNLLSVNPNKEEFDSMIVAKAEEIAAKAASKKKQRSVVTESPVAAASSTSEIVTVSEPAPEKTVDARKTKAQRRKEEAHKQLMKEHAIKRKEKELRKLSHDKASRLAREAEIKQRQEQKLKISAQRIVAEASGEFTLARGAGGRIIQSTDVIPTEIAASLRRIIPMGDPILERRASLLKRRMIEQVPEINNEFKEKVRFARLDGKKAYKMIDKDARDRCVLLG